MNPKVSVIIPVYNTEKHLRECLDSVVNQTFKDIEIICVDDGSTDRSFEILQEYTQKDKRIIILKQNHQGAGVARNRGLKIASGEYLAFLDSDDFYQNNFIEKMYKKAYSTDADIIICSANYYNTATGETALMPWSLETKLLPEKEVFNYKDIPNYIFNIAQNWNWNKLYKHNFILKNEIKFQEIYRTNDLLFTCKALVLADRISTVNEPLVNYRTAQELNCQSTNNLYPLDFYKAFKELKKYLVKTKKYKIVQKSYISWAIDGCVYNIRSIKDTEISNLVIKQVFTKGLKELDLINYHKLEQPHCVSYLDFKNMFAKYKVESNTFLENIFSIKNSKDKRHNVITLLGLKLKIKRNK